MLAAQMLTKERWGAARFVQSQFGLFVCSDDQHFTEVEKQQDVTPGTILYMTHEVFLEVIGPVFPRGTSAPHIMAVLKRTNILVNAGKLVIFRRATQVEITIPCLCSGHRH